MSSLSLLCDDLWTLIFNFTYSVRSVYKLKLTCRTLAFLGEKWKIPDDWKDWTMKCAQVEMIRAIMGKKISYLSFLLNSGVSPNFRYLRDSPLSIATSHNRTEMVKLLLEAKANPNEGDHCSIVPIEITVDRGDYETTYLLINNGASLNDRRRCLLTRAISKGHKEITELLLQKGVEQNSESINVTIAMGEDQLFAVLIEKNIISAHTIELILIFKRQEMLKILLKKSESYLPVITGLLGRYEKYRTFVTDPELKELLSL